LNPLSTYICAASSEADTFHRLAAHAIGAAYAAGTKGGRPSAHPRDGPRRAPARASSAG
jgi:hypothetical protein